MITLAMSTFLVPWEACPGYKLCCALINITLQLGKTMHWPHVVCKICLVNEIFTTSRYLTLCRSFALMNKFDVQGQVPLAHPESALPTFNLFSLVGVPVASKLAVQQKFWITILHLALQLWVTVSNPHVISHSRFFREPQAAVCNHTRKWLLPKGSVIQSATFLNLNIFNLNKTFPDFLLAAPSTCV